MRKFQEIVMLSLVSLATTIGFSSQAKADQRDGTIERFTCLSAGEPQNRLKGNYVQLNAKDAASKFGFGGGNMALKLSNDGLKSNEQSTGTGGAATFTLGKKETEFKIYVKPVNVNLDHCRVYVCYTNTSGKLDNIVAKASTLDTKSVGNGWSTIGLDLASLPGIGLGVITRISFVLNARGDDGHVLMGNTQLFNKKEILDPSTIIMDESPCDPDKTCRFFVQ